ncbi:hypothetical protein GQ607_009835 [Colletotrichum asianum]|uniref:Uncharacterized protein n=1 Tax=Colletotrichum asianum TaxID=702518 RepID=A0A8H3WB06_9PEZI|nr:hypothetical protein GQ607_009835 [Colletotrichum asianum]
MRELQPRMRLPSLRGGGKRNDSTIQICDQDRGHAYGALRHTGVGNASHAFRCPLPPRCLCYTSGRQGLLCL